MQEVKLSSGTVLELYSSIKELPVGLYKRFNLHVLKDSGIGTDIDSVDFHLGKIMQYLSAGKSKEALEETKNLRYNMFQMLVGTSYTCLSLMCLVRKVNGEVWDDHSDDGLTRLAERLSTEPIGELEQALDDVKKKWIPNWAFISRSILGMTLTSYKE